MFNKFNTDADLTLLVEYCARKKELIEASRLMPRACLSLLINYAVGYFLSGNHQ